jgi:DNA polymerase-3 subunit epsilon
METFITIDFETANESRDSPCEIGLAKFVNGQPVETFHSLLYQERFAPFNQMLHGIKPSDVAKAPKIDEILPEITQFIGEHPLVAHNAAFDLRILQIALSKSSLQFSTSFYCTLVLARHTLGLPENTLTYVSDQLGIVHPGDHRAVNDATTCGFIAIKMLADRGFDNFQEFAASLNVRPGQINSDDVVGSVKKSSGSGTKMSRERREEILRNISEDDLYLDPDFEGKNVVFTGALSAMSRTDAQVAVMRAGGYPQDNVTKSTNMLVYGYQDPGMLRGKPMSGKRLRASELRSKGADIEIVDEALFLEMLSTR